MVRRRKKFQRLFVIISITMDLSKLDIVYCIKNGADDCEELRYSLRSLANFPHRKIFIYGGAPTWIQNVNHIPMTQSNNKWVNTTKMLQEACYNNDITPNFVWFNDDFFVMKPVDKLEYWCDRDLYSRANDFCTPYRLTSRYGQTLIDIASHLEANNKPVLNFALHIPIIFNRRKFIQMCLKYPNIVHGRSLYCNEYEVPCSYHDDVKIFSFSDPIPQDTTFLSTSDGSFARGLVGKQIRERFPTRCKYERPAPIPKPYPSQISATPFYGRIKV